ncbi:MAG TPA: hypothetical protein VFV38_36785 [Ktedonobacteraceae bacterium]|nr:hypothetical protein [Ktedonobacteraceae bacterium]
MFAKKHTEVAEQVFEEIGDEQLEQVTGGSGLVTGLAGSLLTMGTNAASGVMATGANASLNLANGCSINVAGVGVTLPGVNSLGLL